MKDSIFLQTKKHDKYQLCVMDFVSHQGFTPILIDMSLIQLVCLFDIYLLVLVLSMTGLQIRLRNLKIIVFLFLNQNI